MRNEDLPEEPSGVLKSTAVTALCGIPFMPSVIRREARFAAAMYVGVDCSVPVDAGMSLLWHQNGKSSL
jgi:hypothetical protein